MRYLILLLTLAACRAPQGVVLDSPLAPQVQATLGSTRADLPRLVLDDAPTLPNGARAICYEDRIVLAAEGQAAFDFYVAHELVHWYIDDSPYAGLPHFIEEGLADWISCDLTGVLEDRIVESIAIETMSIDPRHLDVTAAGWSLLSRDERESLTRAGFDLVRRLGLSELRELREARVSARGYLHAAGIL
jgi:hypothetical protein